MIRATSSTLSTWLIVLLLLSAGLLFYDLGGPSLSVDEFINVQIERGNWQAILADLRVGRDLHPPLTHLIMSLWLRLAGETEWTVRLPWALAGLLNLYLIYRLGAALQSQVLGLMAALLTLTAPTYVLYTRFEKYYALTITLSLLLLLAGLRLWRYPQIRNAFVYWLILVLLLYTDYFAPLFLVLGQNLLLLFYGREWRRTRLFWIAQAGAGVAFLPWIGLLLSQADTLQSMVEADLGFGLRGVLLKIAYLVYSFSLGETLFPWRPIAILGGLTTVILLFIGIWQSVRTYVINDRVPLLALWSALAIPAVLGSAILTSFLFTTVPFIGFPNHILFLLPLFAMLLATSLLALPKRWWTMLAVASLLLPRSVGIYNYFNGLDFHNPIYAVPTREIVRDIVAEVKPGDIVLSATDIGFHYYYERGPQPIPAPRLDNAESTMAYLAEHKPQRVWLLRFGRDRTRQKDPEAVTQALLAAGYQLALEEGYVEQDPTYRQIKEQLLGRTVYRYKLVVQRYDR